MRGYFKGSDAHAACRGCFFKRHLAQLQHLNCCSLPRRKRLNSVSQCIEVAVCLLSGIRVISCKGYGPIFEMHLL